MIQIQIGNWKASILPENEITYRIKLSTIHPKRKPFTATRFDYFWPGQAYPKFNNMDTPTGRLYSRRHQKHWDHAESTLQYQLNNAGNDGDTKRYVEAWTLLNGLIPCP